MKLSFKFFLIVLMATFLSCKKDKKNEPEPEPIPVETGKLSIEFENIVDSLPLVFGQKYTNANGDTFTVSKFNYIISNIVVTKNDNSTFAEANSYHIVRHSTGGSNLLSLTNIPLGSYKSISFMLGVDSTTNASGSKTGALDLTNASDMYWDWSTGYIAMKFEGNSPQSGAAAKTLAFHTGGYGGVNKAQRTFNFGFEGATANVSKNATPIVHLSVDVNELFKSPNTIKFTTQYSQMSPGAGTKIYADNYTNMIKFEHVHN